MPQDFRGVIGRYRNESTPWWPPKVRPPAGAPNILIIVIDDVGFAQLGCFGSDIDTPTFDGLAREGLRYSNFHTTALCSPTRACVLTGRNHHSAGMGRVADLPTGFPGYYNRIPKSAGFLSPKAKATPPSREYTKARLRGPSSPAAAWSQCGPGPPLPSASATSGNAAASTCGTAYAPIPATTPY